MPLILSLGLGLFGRRNREGRFWPTPVSIRARCLTWSKGDSPRGSTSKGGGEIKDPRRKEARKAFLPELYRLRAIGEGMFGGLKTMLNGKLRNLLPAISQKESFLLAIYYGFASLSRYLFVVLYHSPKNWATKRLGHKMGAWPGALGGLLRSSFLVTNVPC